MAKSEKQSEQVTQGKLWVRAHFKGKDGKEVTKTSEEKQLEVQVFEVEPAYVRASYGLTLNLGNYESARCDAGVTLPCFVEEIPAAFKKAWALAEAEVQKQVAEIRDSQ